MRSKLAFELIPEEVRKLVDALEYLKGLPSVLVRQGAEIHMKKASAMSEIDLGIQEAVWALHTVRGMLGEPEADPQYFVDLVEWWSSNPTEPKKGDQLMELLLGAK